MSRENVETFRAMIEDFGTSPSESDWQATLAEFGGLLDPEIEWV
jgi:hypothetical protein